MSISSVTPTLTGAPELLLRRSGPDVRADQLAVDPGQLVNPRLAVDGRPQVIQTAAPSEGSVKRKDQKDQEQDEAEDEDGLTESEQREVVDLKQHDREVRSHEQAHLSAAGPYARSGAQFDLVVGPDGRSYASGGEVKIDTAPIADEPAATIRKMHTVRSAALAPKDPSAEDRQVAALASREITEAQRDLAAEQRESAVGDRSRVSRASSEYTRNAVDPNDPRRSLFDFTA